MCWRCQFCSWNVILFLSPWLAAMIFIIQNLTLVPKNWCFWTVMLEKTLESPLDCKEIQPGHPKGESVLGVLWKEWCWSWNASTLATSCEELTHWKRLWCWEGLGQEEKGTTEDEMAGWHHWLDGRESQWTPGVGDGQGGLACCDSWGRKELDMTERLNWTELNVGKKVVFKLNLV